MISVWSAYIVILEQDSVTSDLCNPSPCGSNANCQNGICTCREDFIGDPYTNCRPECVGNEECEFDKACVHNKCIDPCIGICGLNAECSIFNHLPACSCPSGTSGNAFISCNPYKGIWIFILYVIHYVL